MTKIDIGNFAIDSRTWLNGKVLKVTGHDQENHIGIWYDDDLKIGSGSIPNEHVRLGTDPDQISPLSTYSEGPGPVKTPPTGSQPTSKPRA